MTEVPKRFRIHSFLLALASLAPVARIEAVETAPPPVQVLVSVRDQRLAVVRDGELVARFAVSTSKFGVGDSFGSYKTPLGAMRVCDKIGERLSPGAVIRHRSPTGEVLPPNAPGRDPIVTRVIWLDGLEDQNRHARSRGIYIHGTPEERTIGTPASYGCIRMRSTDVIKVFDEVPVGTMVSIIDSKLPHMRKYEPPRESEPATPATLENQPAPASPAPSRPVVAKSTPQPWKQSAKEEPLPRLASAHDAAQLTPIGEAPGSSASAAARLKGSLLLANLPRSARD